MLEGQKIRKMVQNIPKYQSNTAVVIEIVGDAFRRKFALMI